MASKSVVDTVEAYLGANWTTTSIIGINTTGEVPADGSSFLTLQYPVANEQHVGMGGVGDRAFRETGAIRLVLSVPRAQGQGQGLAWCETLRTLFRAKDITGPGGLVRTREPSPPIVNNANDDGIYWVLSFAIPYWFDLIA